jgi:hypothetical protein
MSGREDIIPEEGVVKYNNQEIYSWRHGDKERGR